jgi:hypothetical protein
MVLLPPDNSHPSYEPSVTGLHAGTAWVWRPQVVFGLFLSFDADPFGLHLGTAIKYSSETHRQACRRQLFANIARCHPCVRVRR